MSKRPTPAEFAKIVPARGGGRACWVCSIKDAQLLNDAKTKDGLTLEQIRQYAIQVLGYSKDLATPGKFRGHFVVARHHER